MDGTDLSTCAKSNGSKLMATGDDFGKIKVYSFPVTQPKVWYYISLVGNAFFQTPN